MMTIQPFKRKHIHRIKEICDSGMYQGVILTGISSEDQRYLEDNPLSVPTVLFNRKSSTYSFVHVDTYEIGRKSAELFAMRGHKKVGTIVPDHLVRSENNLRFKGFVESCAKYGLEPKSFNADHCSLRFLMVHEWLTQEIRRQHERKP
ncbi:hypothetical protein [Paenibacillus glycanilyticus]|uniref:hypothetical protein n=1 Tax=Paenibacillus glycanilyticus TaxID=126569 RepID=UPI0015800CDF|nr:hypothetical protein [Paenibacillus glycanilyticus]